MKNRSCRRQVAKTVIEGGLASQRLWSATPELWSATPELWSATPAHLRESTQRVEQRTRTDPKRKRGSGCPGALALFFFVERGRWRLNYIPDKKGGVHLSSTSPTEPTTGATTPYLLPRRRGRGSCAPHPSSSTRITCPAPPLLSLPRRRRTRPRTLLMPSWATWITHPSGDGTDRSPLPSSATCLTEGGRCRPQTRLSRCHVRPFS